MTWKSNEVLFNDILRASLEAPSLRDLSAEIVPLLERYLDASGSGIYRCGENGNLTPLGGVLSELTPYYVEQYIQEDPLHLACFRQNRRFFHAADCPEFQEYLQLPAYTEGASRFDYHDYIHVRLNRVQRSYEPGMVGFLLGRTRRQSNFGEDEMVNFARLLPAMESLIRRNDRLERQLRAGPCLEALGNERMHPTMAFDLGGGLLWASQSASPFLQGKNSPILEILAAATRDLGFLWLKKNREPKTQGSIALPPRGNEPLQAELSLHRTVDGTPFLLAELITSQPSPFMEKIGKKFDLTATETKVLWLLSKGLSDREMAGRLFVSVTTIRTHLGHILDKMGVKSRVLAILKAHGSPHS